MPKRIRVTSLHQLAGHEFMYMVRLSMLDVQNQLSDNDKKTAMEYSLHIIKTGITLGIKGLTTPNNAAMKVPIIVNGHKTNFMGITDSKNRALVSEAIKRRHYFSRVASDIKSKRAFLDKVKLLIQDYLYIYYDCSKDSKTKYKFIPLSKDKKYTISNIIKTFTNQYNPKHQQIVLDITEALVSNDHEAVAIVTYISKNQFNPFKDIENKAKNGIKKR